MKQVMVVVGALLISASSFAAGSSSGLTNSSPQLNAFGSAWKSYSTIQPKKNPNGITIVYGGEDISRRPTLDPHTTTA